VASGQYADASAPSCSAGAGGASFAQPNVTIASIASATQKEVIIVDRNVAVVFRSPPLPSASLSVVPGIPDC
jgi:hypothetical protein